MKLTDIAVDRPIATTMVFLIIIVIGVLGFRFLPVDLLPAIEFPQLTVWTSYPNVGPEEIERIITDRIENALAVVPSVEKIRSSSAEGTSRVTLEFSQGTNIDEAANDVRAALDRIRGSFPPEIDPPRLFKFDPDNFPVVILGARSALGMAELTRILEREISQRFEQIPGAGSVDVWGGVYREIQIRLKRDRLASSRLTAADVQAALQRENVTLPGGDMREGTRDMYVRTRGEYQSLEEIAATIITAIDGKPVRVSDVAEVVDGYEDINRLVQVDGQPMVRLGVRKQSGANTVAVAHQARRIMDRINQERDDFELLMIIDQSEFIQSSIDNVKNSALWGGLLAVFILYVFLRNGSTTFIIALSIPISLIATFGLIYFNGFTLNQMSFGGLALGIGLIVDNAIVVLDNIVRLRENGRGLRESSLVGAQQVAGAIIASTLTTSVIFLPVVFMRTISGMIFLELALVVVFALLCSLMVALTLVPMLASRYLTVGAGGEAGRVRVLRRFGVWFSRLENAYSRWLASVIRHRTLVFVTTGLALAVAILLWPLLPMELAPQTDADEIDIDLEMAQGTNIAVINEFLHELEAIVHDAAPMDEVEHITIQIRPGAAEVELSLVSSDRRSLDSTLMADEIRRRVAGRIPGAEIRVRAQSGLWMLRRLFGSGSGDAVQVELRGYDLELADSVAKNLEQVMMQVEGVQDVRISRREGRPEQNLVLDREKIADLGISVREVAQIIQANIGGIRAGVFREGGDEFPIVMRLQPTDRLTTGDLAGVSIRTAAGQILPLSALMHAERRRSPTTIERVNGQRVTFITANLESGVALGDVIDALRVQLRDFALPADFSLLFGGEYEEQQKAQRNFTLSIIMAVILIYMVMAAQFERFIDPLIVMFSVPLALIGVVPTLLLTGTSLNIQSMMGIVMLIGIVVNNAIVLVDYINLMRREGQLDVTQAVMESGRLRLRPILMTASTTVLGMLPLAIGGGVGGEIQAALARAVIGGLSVSTLITLVVIPAAYTGVHDLRQRFGRTARLRSAGALAPKPAGSDPAAQG